MSDHESSGLYPGWRPPVMPDWPHKCSKAVYRHCAYRWQFCAREVEQARIDGLDHIVPVLMVEGASPQEIRARVGRQVWREIHKASKATNIKRAWLVIAAEGRLNWGQATEIRTSHLSAARRVYKQKSKNLTPRVIWASRVAEGRKVQFFREASDLYQDAVRMGIAINEKWSLKRLRKEHDAAALRLALQSADPTPWAEPWSREIKGYRFERIISNADLASEGIMQRHCIASYQREASNGDVIVFRIIGPERATYAFSAFPGRDAREQWSELKLARNWQAPQSLHQIAHDLRSMFVDDK